MQYETKIIINNNPNLKRYLKEHSYWYKSLNRNPLSIKEMEEEMKKEYRLTTIDKIERLSDKINLLNDIMNIFK